MSRTFACRPMLIRHLLVGVALATLVVLGVGAVDVAGQGAVLSVAPPHADSSVPAIDGRLDDLVWRDSVVLQDFWVPDRQHSADRPTEVRLVRNATTLYVAFSCLGDSSPRARSGPGLRDHVTVEVDPGSTRAYRTFTVNRDGQLFENGSGGDGWPAAWRAAAFQHDDDWSAELALPLELLVQHDLAADLGIDFVRYRAEAREWSRWAHCSSSISTGPPGAVRARVWPGRRAGARCPTRVAGSWDRSDAMAHADHADPADRRRRAVRR